MSKRLSAHFVESEFKCHCGTCGKPKVSSKLLDLLEKLREKTGPLFIMSGYRCSAHNRAVGGKRYSQHLLGTAADLTSKTLTPKELADIVEPMLSNDGLGRYHTFTHIDVRGKNARWGSN